MAHRLSWVTSGVLTLSRVGETATVGEGDVLEVPAGVVHELRHESNADAEFVVAARARPAIVERPL